MASTKNSPGPGFSFAALAEHATGSPAGAPLDQQHQARTFTQPGPGGQDANGAYCSCGWRSQLTSTPREAEIAALLHRVENAEARWVISELLDEIEDARLDARGLRDQVTVVCEEIGADHCRVIACQLREAATRQRFELPRRTRVAAAALLTKNADQIEARS